MVYKSRNNRSKILVVGNSGISVEEVNRAYTPKDTGSFLLSLKKFGYIITYADSRGNSKKNKFIYTYSLIKSDINYFIIRGGRRNPFYYIGLIKLAYNIIKNEAVYLYYPGGFSSVTACLCKFLGKKYGVFVRGYGLYIPDSKRTNEKENIFSNAFILKNASFLITVSPRMQSELLQLNENVYVVNNLLWTTEDIYCRENKDYHLSFWKFLFIGSITEMKGITDLMEVAKILNDNKINFRLRIVGDGYLLNNLINRQIAGEIPENIEFIGSVTDKIRLEEEYHNADAFIFPSRTEGFPRVLYEAMLKSLPIFSTMSGGISGIMKPGYNCIELPVRDPRGQAEAVMSGIKEPELIKRIAENGLETIKNLLKQKKQHHEVLHKKIS